MEYLVKIRGLDKPITTSSQSAEKLRQKLDSYYRTKEDEIFVSDGETFRVSAVLSIQKDRSGEKTDNFTKRISEQNEKDKQERLRLRKLTPEQKGQRIGFAKIVYWGITGKRLEEDKELTEAVVNLQTDFFKNNQNRIIPDPSIFKELFGGNQMNSLAFDVVSKHSVNDK